MKIGVGEGYQSLLPEREFVDELSTPPPPLPPSCWSQWGTRCVAVLGVSGSVALKVANLSLWTNALGSFGAGFFALYGVSLAFSKETQVRVRQVCLTIFGQFSMFALAQAYANDDQSTDESALVNAMIALFGANTQIVLWWLTQQGLIRAESQPHLKRKGQTLTQLHWVSHNVSHGLKAIPAAGLGYISARATDPIVRGPSSFFCTFFPGQIIGEKAIDWIDREIEKRDAGGGTQFRKLKIAILTIAYLGQIFAFIPWKNPSTSEQIKDLYYVGAALGISDGLYDRSVMVRLKGIPIKDLEEWQKLPPPEKPTGEKGGFSLCKWIAYKTWLYGIHILCPASVIGFTVWQEGWKLENNDARVALGSMLTGFLGAFSLLKLVDRVWDPYQRHCWKDKLMEYLWASPRIFGVDPLFFYYAATNAVKIDSAAIESDRSPYRTAAVVAAWFAYGLRMGHELVITSSDRIGNAQQKYPRMAMINGALTTVLYIRGMN